MDSRVLRVWLSCCGVIAVTLLVTVADRTGHLSGTRTVLHDVLSPGRFAVMAISPISTGQPPDEQLAALHEELHRNELQRRQLLIENARLHNELRTSRQTTELPGPPLVEFETVPAAILSHSGMSDRLTDLFIDVGKSAGMRRSELVLDGAGMLIDQGDGSNVQAGDQVLSGLTVVGRIAKTGRWVSLIQPVTSSLFTSRIQLVRRSDQGAYFGAVGLLTGDDNGHCRITGIPYTESVTVGDDVFSADVEGINGPTLFFGTVTQADFLSGGEWSIIVRPAADLTHIENVAVLRTTLNHERLPQ